MAWLGKVLGRRAGTVGNVRVDELCGDAAAHEWAARLGRGEWRGFGDFLRTQQDIETRDFYMRTLPTKLKGWPSWLDEWVESAPEDAMARTFRAARSTRYAWEARGGGYAETVKRESWPLFFSRLDAAESDLVVASNLTPDDPGPWVAMITVAMGKSMGIDEVRRRFAEVERRHPNHAQACQQVLQAVAAKWGGSHELMFEFARSVGVRAPEGSAAHAVIATAHYEFWIAEKAGNMGYFKRPDIRAEIAEAARRCFTSSGDSPRTLIARGSFAMLYMVMNEAALAVEQIDLAGGIVAEPLSWVPNVGALVAQARLIARKQAART